MQQVKLIEPKKVLRDLLWPASWPSQLGWHGCACMLRRRLQLEWKQLTWHQTLILVAKKV